MQVIGDDQRHPQEFEIVAAGEAVMNYDGYFLHALARLRKERRYRVFADLERIAERYPRARIGKWVRGGRAITPWRNTNELSDLRERR